MLRLADGRHVITIQREHHTGKKSTYSGHQIRARVDDVCGVMWRDVV